MQPLHQMLCEVLWHDDTQEIDITKGGISVKLTIGNTTAYVNGEQTQLDTAPDIRSGRTLYPCALLQKVLNLMLIGMVTAEQLQ